MPRSIAEKDTLPHVNPSESLSNRALLKSGSFTLFSEAGVSLEITFGIQGDSLTADLKLSALGESTTLGSATLEIGQTTTLSGHVEQIAKAEISICLQEKPISLVFDAEICTRKSDGNWQCESTGKHSINL